MSDYFFSLQQNVRVIKQFHTKLDHEFPNEEFEKERNRAIRFITNQMVNKPENWQKYSSYSIEWHGNAFIDKLSESDLNRASLDMVCADAFKFLYEYYLSTRDDFGPDANRAFEFIKNQASKFTEEAKELIASILQELPILLFKELANSDAINSIREFNLTAGQATKLKEEWNAEIEEKTNQVNEIRKSLEQYETAFNFVGLYDGFSDIYKEKIEERDSLARWLKILGCLILLPLAIQLIVLALNADDISKIKDTLLVSLVPSISFAAIVIYYFRVILFNYKSVKSQLLQIELRKTLCRFIQDYSQYSSKIKKEDSGSLEKFENIIFSNIVSDDDKLPSTYDGIEQLTKLFKSAK